MKKPPLAIRALDLSSRCDLCNRPRNKGNHDRCSRRRQQMRRVGQ